MQSARNTCWTSHHVGFAVSLSAFRIPYTCMWCCLRPSHNQKSIITKFVYYTYLSQEAKQNKKPILDCYVCMVKSCCHLSIRSMRQDRLQARAANLKGGVTAFLSPFAYLLQLSFTAHDYMAMTCREEHINTLTHDIKHIHGATHGKLHTDKRHLSHIMSQYIHNIQSDHVFMCVSVLNW